MYEFLRDVSRWTLPDVLAWQADKEPAKIFAQVVGGGAISFGELAVRSGQVASFFAAQGIVKGDPVAVILPNDIDFIVVWAGLARLGSIGVLLNTELIGTFLEHQINDSGAKVVVVHGSFLDVLLDSIDRMPGLELIVTTGRPASSATKSVGRRLAPLADWRDYSVYDGAAPRSTDIANILYTSGTTGLAKGVLMPHAHCYLYGLGAIDNLAMTAEDRYYVTLPLYHANGLFMQVYACLISGATVVLRPRFSASDWLTDIRHHRATLTNMLGVMAPFIVAQPESDADKAHSLRAVVAAPNPAEFQTVWSERFGLSSVVSGFGMTEVNIPVWGRPGVATPPNAAGLVYDRYFEVEIVDPEDDVVRPRGEIGEIVVRPKAPFGFMARYHGLAEQTIQAWRNLWFHTGDAGYMDEDGFVFFKDRIRDCIRRRGHNIASAEIESTMALMPGIAEVAAYAVPSEVPGGEDEIAIAVVPATGSPLTFEAIASFSDAHLPRFSRPRFVSIAEYLPKTSTGKIKKESIRLAGFTAQIWDREAVVRT